MVFAIKPTPLPPQVAALFLITVFILSKRKEQK